MRKLLLIALLLSGLLASATGGEKNREGPKAIEVKVNVGTAEGELIFSPKTFRFERGKYYALIIHNPSPQAHYFNSDAFATHVFTRKVEVLHDNNNVIAEIHGAVSDLELKPGATVRWYFYPMTNGKHLPLYCHKNDHAERGMVGAIEIFGSLSP